MQPNRADKPGYDEIIRFGRNPKETFVPGNHVDLASDFTRSECVANHGDIGRVCHRNDPRRKLPRLLDQALDPATRSDRNNIKAIGMTRNDIKRLLADASSAA